MPTASGRFNPRQAACTGACNASQVGKQNKRSNLVRCGLRVSTVRARLRAGGGLLLHANAIGYSGSQAAKQKRRGAQRSGDAAAYSASAIKVVACRTSALENRLHRFRVTVIRSQHESCTGNTVPYGYVNVRDVKSR